MLRNRRGVRVHRRTGHTHVTAVDRAVRALDTVQPLRAHVPAVPVDAGRLAGRIGRAGPAHVLIYIKSDLSDQSFVIKSHKMFKGIYSQQYIKSKE